MARTRTVKLSDEEHEILLRAHRVLQEEIASKISEKYGGLTVVAENALPLGLVVEVAVRSLLKELGVEDES